MSEHKERAENTFPSQQNGDPIVQFALEYRTRKLGVLFQEQLDIEQSRQKHSHLLERTVIGEVNDLIL